MTMTEPVMDYSRYVLYHTELEAYFHSYQSIDFEDDGDGVVYKIEWTPDFVLSSNIPHNHGIAAHLGRLIYLAYVGAYMLPDASRQDMAIFKFIEDTHRQGNLHDLNVLQFVPVWMNGRGVERSDRVEANFALGVSITEFLDDGG